MLSYWRTASTFVVTPATVAMLRENLLAAARVNRKFDRYFKNMDKYTTLRWHRGAYRDVRKLELEWLKIPTSP